MCSRTGPVLALYDFRGKQEYIYRTNRMREITGASELLARMYDRFLSSEELREIGAIRNDWRWDWEEDKPPAKPLFDDDGIPAFEVGEIGMVVYEGGGNLCVLYRDRNCYLRANHAFSLLVLKEAQGLSLVVACAEWEVTGNPDADFESCRRQAYRALERKKRVGGTELPCNVLPFTQVDAVTYQPIVTRRYKGADRVELSREAECKLAAYQSRADSDSAWLERGKFVDEIGTEKGEDSLIAIVYFDGNDIGDRLTRDVHGVQDMRNFSHEVHDTLVTRTETRMRKALEGMPDERQRDYRVIVDHGDEITLVCNAHAAPLAIDAYFEALEGTGYAACAGMAICHAHDPFSEVYRIAEQCCESGKKRNRSVRAQGGESASYVDFHFCRAGITGSLEQIRCAQEAAHTARPYQVGGSYDTFLRVGELLLVASKIQRSDLKELTRAILRGYSWYAMEYERIRAKDVGAVDEIEGAALGGTGSRKEVRETMRTLLFDVTSFVDIFDIRFGASDGKEGEHVQE